MDTISSNLIKVYKTRCADCNGPGEAEAPTREEAAGKFKYVGWIAIGGAVYCPVCRIRHEQKQSEVIVG